MKKQNPIYIFTTLLSLGIAGFVLFTLVVAMNISFYIVAIVFFLVIAGFFMMIATKLTNGSFETRFKKLKECEVCKKIIPRESKFCPICGSDLEGNVKCEYCGHSNKIGTSVCENCNGLIK